MIDSRYKYSDITAKIICCALEVYKILGNGFQELIYQRALAEEFTVQGVSAIREFEMNVFYKDKAIGIVELIF